ncbi:MAG: TIGR00153 family protein [Hyphomicrobiales bacterium]|nr:TIGR00153 family protein [Hyphomicrobiales bacterium]MCP5373323.1 TIGR00153 family protein [Hyphomicrobiales bacterium]
MAKNPFVSLFGKSPFKPMQQHMDVAAKTARTVVKLLEARSEGDDARFDEAADKIVKNEHKADTIKNEIRSHLPKSLMMPVDRRDLLEILDIQDSIADAAQDIVGLLTIRRMDVPEAMKVELLALAARCADACEHAAAIINTLDELVETGFRGPQVDLVLEMSDELNRIESDTDRIAKNLSQTLFGLEAEMPPVSVILWFKLIEQIAGLADGAEKIGNRVGLLLAR